MSADKKKIRERFRNDTFTRDRHVCRVCKKPSDKMDAHHITNREAMPGGGYVKENGISLCPPCHIKAEEFYSIGTAHPGYEVETLYKLIGSSLEKAIKASEKLLDR